MLNSKFYLILDTGLIKGKDILNFTEEALKGGIDIVQLRDKTLSTKEAIRIGQLLRILTRRYKVKFIVNDRVDIAYAIKADGVHLGQDDLPIATARGILGKDAIMGISASNIEEALRAEKKGADYIGLGPIFKTDIKPLKEPIGTEIIEEAINNIRIPFFLIGGINIDNIKDVIAKGASRIAVASAICLKKDVYKATVELKNALENLTRDFIYKEANDAIRLR